MSAVRCFNCVRAFGGIAVKKAAGISEEKEEMYGGKGMLNVVVCDDEEYFLKRLTEKITAYLTEREITFQLASFCSGEALFQEGKGLYDIAFLDISMDRVNGIETAQHLRKINKKICIIFVTGYMDYVLEGYKVGALRYLVKDSLESSFEECMEAVLQRFHIDTDEICLEFREKKSYLNAEEICLVESRGHKLFFLSARDQSTLGTMNKKLAEVEGLLRGYGFLRIHQSFLVNMRFIVKISSYCLQLQQGITLPVPKKRYPYVKSEYATYLGDSL